MLIARFEKQIDPLCNKKQKQSIDKSQLTRSQTSPYDKSLCFFCEGNGTTKQPLHNVCTFSAGEALNTAINLSNNGVLRIKLGTAINASDAHAIDIKYHKNCWLSNVTNVIRRDSLSNTDTRAEKISKSAARIEFVTMVELQLRDTQCSRKTLKRLLESEIPDIEFHKAKRVNQSDRVSIKHTRDDAIHLSENINEADCEKEIKELFDAAATLRKAVNKCKRWEFSGSLENVVLSDIVPEELYLFCRWLIQGNNGSQFSPEKQQEVMKRATSLSQTIMSLCLSDRQVKNEHSEKLHMSREVPQQLAVSLAVHQATRSKDLLNMLHGFGMALEYNRVLRIEAQIENVVLQRIEQNEGQYIPPDFVDGRHTFFAVDNSDFSEDTYDGKNTLHGTALAIYQKCEPGDIIEDLRLVSRSI